MHGDCDWHEVGRQGEGVPQLNFRLPLANPVRAYQLRYPLWDGSSAGRRRRMCRAIRGARRCPEDGRKPAVQLITEGNYGFRGDDNALA